MLNPNPFADDVRGHPNVKIVELTRANHDQVLREIMEWLK
jgi:nucleoside-triphosphatase THEP1